MNRLFVFMVGLALGAGAFADVSGDWLGNFKKKAGVKTQQGSYYLFLKKDGTYRMGSGSTAAPQITEGTWRQKGAELTIVPSAESKKKSPMVKDRVLKIGPGEKTLTLSFTSKIMAEPYKGPAPKTKAEVQKILAKAKLKDITVTIEFKRA